MKVSPYLAIVLALASLSLPACDRQTTPPREDRHKIISTSPMVKDVVLTRKYVCQLHSLNHTNIRALKPGYLEQITIKEGQTVKKGDPLFKIVPILYQTKLDAALAEAKLAQLEYNNSNRLFKDKVVSSAEVALYEAKLAKANANAKQLEAELGFATVKAPFDGIIDRLFEQQGSLVKEGDNLTNLSDNSVMWAYFNVPEARYLGYEASKGREKEDQRIELALANGKKFAHIGKFETIEANFNSQTGNIPFRADFPNPDALLRHGQTGSVLIHHTLRDALVIPQRATYEILDRRYVYVVDKDNVVHQREIVVKDELEDVFILKSGLDVADKIVLEGVRQVRNGEKTECEFRSPEEVFRTLKNPAE